MTAIIQIARNSIISSKLVKDLVVPHRLSSKKGDNDTVLVVVEAEYTMERFYSPQWQPLEQVLTLYILRFLDQALYVSELFLQTL